ncbi:MAG: hypothetical protein AABY22_32125, partial [Nanoarchaeota archaeon]
MQNKFKIRIEKQIGEDLISYLNREYTQNLGRLVTISKNIGVGRRTLSKFMKANNIDVRQPSNTLWNNTKITPTKNE